MAISWGRSAVVIKNICCTETSRHVDNTLQAVSLYQAWLSLIHRALMDKAYCTQTILVACGISGQAVTNQPDSLSRLLLTGKERQQKCQHHPQSALTMACHVGTEIGFEGGLDGALLYAGLYAQLLQGMRILAVPAPRAAALVKEIIAPACVEVIWQESLHNNSKSHNQNMDDK